MEMAMGCCRLWHHKIPCWAFSWLQILLGGSGLDPRTYGYEQPLEALNVGDLVKVSISHWDSPPTICLGVVVQTVSNSKNKTLFPSVRVYNLETKKITREFIGSLKVVSKIVQ